MFTPRMDPNKFGTQTPETQMKIVRNRRGDHFWMVSFSSPGWDDAMMRLKWHKDPSWSIYVISFSASRVLQPHSWFFLTPSLTGWWAAHVPRSSKGLQNLENLWECTLKGILAEAAWFNPWLVKPGQWILLTNGAPDLTTRLCGFIPLAIWRGNIYVFYAWESGIPYVSQCSNKPATSCNHEIGEMDIYHLSMCKGLWSQSASGEAFFLWAV